MEKVKITFAEKYALLNRPFNFQFPAEYTEYSKLSQEEFEQQVSNQDVLIICDLDVNQTVLDRNPNLSLVALCSTGYNHINLDLLKKNGVKVCNIRGQATDAVAEHAFTLMIHLFKNFSQQVDGIKQGLWSNDHSAFYLAAPMRELKNKTLVILGKGSIGISLAEKAKAFGMHVIFSERKTATDCRDGYIPFAQAIAQADVVSLHCKLNAETKHMIDAEFLSLMKNDSILINAGRGDLVNDADLVNALTQGSIAGYGTDVLNQEPPSPDHPILQAQKQLPNICITGHIAWATDEAQERLFDFLEENLNKNIQGTEHNLV